MKRWIVAAGAAGLVVVVAIVLAIDRDPTPRQQDPVRRAELRLRAELSSIEDRGAQQEREAQAALFDLGASEEHFYATEGSYTNDLYALGFEGSEGVYPQIPIADEHRYCIEAVLELSESVFHIGSEAPRIDDGPCFPPGTPTSYCIEFVVFGTDRVWHYPQGPDSRAGAGRCPGDISVPGRWIVSDVHVLRRRDPRFPGSGHGWRIQVDAVWKGSEPPREARCRYEFLDESNVSIFESKWTFSSLDRKLDDVVPEIVPPRRVDGIPVRATMHCEAGSPIP